MPEGTTELGIDIIKIERIAAALKKFGRPLPERRVLTEAEARYVRNRPENFAGRWAAKEAVSQGARPGRPRRRLARDRDRAPAHRRADGPAPRPRQARAEQLGMGRIAVSISHEGEYAVAIAFGIRTAGGTFVFPLDIEARLDDRERQILARMERLRDLEQESRGG